jgi:hypothetical protein
MNIPDHISESLETSFWVKIFKLFGADPDPGSGILFNPRSGIRDGTFGTQNKHSGSATLLSKELTASYGILERKVMPNH